VQGKEAVFVLLSLSGASMRQFADAPPSLVLRFLNKPTKTALSFFARQGAKRANTRWYLTDEQRSIAEKGGAGMWGYLKNGVLVPNRINTHHYLAVFLPPCCAVNL